MSCFAICCSCYREGGFLKDMEGWCWSNVPAGIQLEGTSSGAGPRWEKQQRNQNDFLLLARRARRIPPTVKDAPTACCPACGTSGDVPEPAPPSTRTHAACCVCWGPGPGWLGANFGGPNFAPSFFLELCHKMEDRGHLLGPMGNPPPRGHQP